MNQSNLLASRYRIIKKLEDGGFGITYLAQDSHLPSGKTCIIKQLRPINNDPQIYQLVKERFQREAVILEELGNENLQIPTLLAYFAENGHFYLVQEYIKGRTLSKLVQEKGKQPQALVEKILVKTLDVLQYIQAKGIIHRDIKPDNIILRENDNMPVLIDFGAVRESMGTVISSSGNTTSSIVIGTPGFMPPEQGVGRPVFSSDLYALGLTAIYLLTGKMPQELPTDPLTGKIFWREEVKDIEPNLANVLDQVINPQASSRFMTAEAMKKAIQGVKQTRVIPSERRETIPSLPAAWLKMSMAVAGTSLLVIAGGGLLLSQLNSNQTPDNPTATKTKTENNSPKDIREDKAIDNNQSTSDNQIPPPEVLPPERKVIWRSESALTRITGLDRICWGSSRLNEVQTVFGYDKFPFTGSISIPSPQRDGCDVGDSQTGRFYLSGKEEKCLGEIRIQWRNNNNAFLSWKISNIGSECPVAKANWSINTYPIKSNLLNR